MEYFFLLQYWHWSNVNLFIFQFCVILLFLILKYMTKGIRHLCRHKINNKIICVCFIYFFNLLGNIDNIQIKDIIYT